MSNYKSLNLDNNSSEKSKNSVFSKLISKLKPNKDEYFQEEITEPRSVVSNFSNETNMSVTGLVKKVKKNLSFNVRSSMESLNYKTNRVYWMPDSVCLNCYNCDSEFTTVLRKHHCRMCGQIFCYRCCNHELPGELWDLKKPQKSCRQCYLSYYHRYHKSSIGNSTTVLPNSRNINSSNYPSWSNMASNNRNYKKSYRNKRAQYGQAYSQNFTTVRFQVNSSGSTGLLAQSNGEQNNSEIIEDVNGLPSSNIQSNNDYLREKSSSNTSLANYRYKKHSKSFNKRIPSNHDFDGDVEYDDDDDDIDEENDQLYTSNNYPFLKRTNSLPKNLDRTLPDNKPNPPYSSKGITKKASKNIIFKGLFPILNQFTSDDPTPTNNYDISNEDYKKILLFVWNCLVKETQELKQKYKTNAINDEKDEDDDEINLNLVIKNEFVLVSGNSLVEWIVKRNSCVQDRFNAKSICQSYLEMRLLTPYFQNEDYFKDDGSLYIIEEFIADCSPQLFSTDTEQFFPDTEGPGDLTSSGIARRNTGNSIFYNTPDGVVRNVSDDPGRAVNKIDFTNLKIRTPSVALNSTKTTGDNINSNRTSCAAILWMRNCEYLEHLLKQELRDYNLDIKWTNVLLPIFKVISETVIMRNFPNNLNNNDIRNAVQIKKIPSTSSPDCRILYSVSMTKNVTLPTNGAKEIKNASVLLIKSSIDYYRYKKLVSLEPVILQEEEFIRNCVRKISKLRPDIVIVEGSVSLAAREMMEKCGLVIISNVRREQMARLSRMLQTKIVDSVDSLGASIDQTLGRCSQVFCHSYKLYNGRSKNIVYFNMTNKSFGCTVTIHSNSLSELVLIKYIFRYMLLAFKNAHIEVTLFKDLQFRSIGNKSMISSYSEHHIQESSSVFLDLLNTRLLTISGNVKYDPPPSLVRSVNGFNIQDKLLEHPINVLSPNNRLSDVLNRKTRHILAKKYEEVRMETRRHPCMLEPEIHPLMNCRFQNGKNPLLQLSNTNMDIMKQKSILYADFRANGSRFKNGSSSSSSPFCMLDNKWQNGCVEKKDLNENLICDTIVSTTNFDKSELAVKMGFVTRWQERRWKNLERKAFDSVRDKFNPRNFTETGYAYFIKCSTGYCYVPKTKISKYYEKADRGMGSYFNTLLDERYQVCVCGTTEYDHIFSYVQQNGVMELSIHPIDPTCMDKVQHPKSNNSTSINNNETNLSAWTWCSRCDKTLGIQKLSEDTHRLSFGRFVDLICNINLIDTGLLPAQCNHSLQNDIYYYFMKPDSKRVIEIKYKPIQVFEFQPPDLLIEIPRLTIDDKQKYEAFQAVKSDVKRLSEIKMKCNLEIKDKICQLKSNYKSSEDLEICEFLQKESDSAEYSNKMHELHNIIDSINEGNKFDMEKFDKTEEYLREEIIRLWQEISSFLLKWDARLHESFEEEKRNVKLDSKTLPNRSVDDMPSVVNDPVSKSTGIHIISRSSTENISENCEIKPNTYQSDTTSNYKFVLDDCIMTVPTYNSLLSPSLPESVRVSTEDILSCEPKEKSNHSRDTLDSIQASKAVNNQQTGPSNNFKKFFQNLFHNGNLKILTDCTPADKSFVFDSVQSELVPIVVSDSSVTSAVAYVLCSDQYQNFLRQNSNKEKTNTLVMDTKSHSSSNLLDTPQHLNVVSKSLSPFVSRKSNQSNKHAIFTGSTESGNVVVAENVDSIEKINKDDIVVHYKPKCNSGFSDDNDDLIEEDVHYAGKLELPLDGPKIAARILDNLSGNQAKKGNKTDFEIILQNHKVRCTVKIYYAKLFHDLRMKLTNNDEKGFIMSLAQTNSWVTTGGKSGLKFRKTTDNRFITKELSNSELNGFKKFHVKYFNYLEDKINSNEKCVLAKILGIYQVDYHNALTKQTQKSEFLVMENVFHSQNPSRKFDLKGKKHAAGPGNINVNNMPSGSTNMSGALPSGVVKNHFQGNGTSNMLETSAIPAPSSNMVMQDKDFILYSQTNPIFVSWQAHLALRHMLLTDSEFLSLLPVMDYSLLIGLENGNCVEEPHRILMGLIDYLRMFTVDKLIEMHVKRKIFMANGHQPTIIEPGNYQERFVVAMNKYFVVAPGPWDSLLAWYTTAFNPNVTIENELLRRRDELESKIVTGPDVERRNQIVVRQHSPEVVANGNENLVHTNVVVSAVTNVGNSNNI